MLGGSRFTEGWKDFTLADGRFRGVRVSGQSTRSGFVLFGSLLVK
jgi:hypothetical protein